MVEAAQYLHEAPPQEPGYLEALTQDATPGDYTVAIRQAAAQFETAVQGEAAQTEPETPRFTLLSAADILAMQQVQWRVKGAVPAAGLAAIFGQPGSAKTFIALDMAFTIIWSRAAGLKSACWHGSLTASVRCLTP